VSGGIAALLIANYLTKKPRKSYKGKIIIITGASSGIGEELAYQYSKEGAKLVLAARRIEKLNNVVKKCQDLGAQQVISVQTDASKESDCKGLIDATIKAYNGIDLLLLNAGQSCLIHVRDSKPEHFKVFHDLMDTNFFGYVYPTIYALPHLQKSKGTIIAISSLAGIFAPPKRAIYGATKAAVNNFFNVLRNEEPDIQVTVVCPGFVISEIHDKAFKSDAKLERNLKNFMTTATCATIIINAGAEGKREEVMTGGGKLGVFLKPFVPSLVDYLTRRSAAKSILHPE